MQGVGTEHTYFLKTLVVLWETRLKNPIQLSSWQQLFYMLSLSSSPLKLLCTKLNFPFKLEHSTDFPISFIAPSFSHTLAQNPELGVVSDSCLFFTSSHPGHWSPFLAPACFSFVNVEHHTTSPLLATIRCQPTISRIFFCYSFVILLLLEGCTILQNKV